MLMPDMTTARDGPPGGGPFAKLEGTYDLWFGPDRVTGTFSAPHCTLCAPRPNTQACLKA
jgi:hypothetical protein